MLKNVELIDIQTNGNELIANASAVASIGGSSIIQAEIGRAHVWTPVT